MRKLVIPLTICVFALVGAVLLLLQVEDAMAVHTTIATNINKQDRYISFYINNNATSTLSNVIIIPDKTSHQLKVEVTSVSLDGAGGALLFEETDGTKVLTGAIRQLGSGNGLQIANILVNSEHYVSVVVAEDDE